MLIPRSEISEEWVKVKAKARLIGGYSDCVQALKSKSKLKHNGAEELNGVY